MVINSLDGDLIVLIKTDNVHEERMLLQTMSNTLNSVREKRLNYSQKHERRSSKLFKRAPYFCLNK